MLDIGMELHGWIWRSTFAFPLLLIALFRLVERTWRRGRDGIPVYIRGSVYVILIAAAVPFLAALLADTPLLRWFPLGPLQFNLRFVAAILVFAVLWVEPEIARFNVLRGIGKLAALYVALEVLATNASLPASQGLHTNAVALRAVVALLTIWTLYAAALYVAYRSSMRPRQSLGFNLASAGMLALIAAATLPPRFSLAMIALLIGAYPYLVAVGMHPPAELSARAPGDLYRDGLQQLGDAWREWIS